MLKTPLTGVDSSTVFTLSFTPTETSSLAAQAILSCSINLDAPSPGVIIRFERGTILINPPIYSPRSFKVIYLNKGAAVGNKTVTEGTLTKTFEYAGKGWHFQADEVARCARHGKLESEVWGHDKSLLEMEIFDEVSNLFTGQVLVSILDVLSNLCSRSGSREGTSFLQVSRRSCSQVFM